MSIASIVAEPSERGEAIGGGGERRAPVTVLGLGLMGRALAGAFLGDGHPTTVWNRTASRADELVARGASGAATAGEAASASPLVVACLADYAAVRDVLDSVGDDLSGRVLVNLTSGTPEEARKLATWAAARDINYLDGAIMAIPAMIGQPDTVILYSGSPAAFEANRPTLAILGGGAEHLGADAGLAALYDLALLGIMYALYGGFFHALALVGTAGVDGATFMPHASRLLGTVTSWLPDDARDIDAGDYATEVATLDVQKAAIAHIVEASRAADVGADVLLPVQALIDRRVDEGHDADGLASLIEAMRSRRAHEGHGDA